MLRWAADLLLAWHQRRRRVRLTTHVAHFGDGILCYFLNVTNLSQSREVEITHVWFELDPPVDVLNDERPLPARLRPDESWETWTRVATVGADPAVALRAGRVRLSTDAVVRSRGEPRRLPSAGAVPGGRP